MTQSYIQRWKDKGRSGIAALEHRWYMRLYIGSLRMELDNTYANWLWDKDRNAYMKKYMAKYRKRRGYLAGRKKEDYNAYMKRKMREYRERKKNTTQKQSLKMV